MLKKIIVGVLCIMMVFPLIGCNLFKSKPNFPLDTVIVHIKAEFEQEFEEQTFTIEDFEWGNIDRIAYIVWWYDNVPEPYGYMVVYLIESGENQVLDAIEHFKTLDFVKDAKKSHTMSWN